MYKLWNYLNAPAHDEHRNKGNTDLLHKIVVSQWLCMCVCVFGGCKQKTILLKRHQIGKNNYASLEMHHTMKSVMGGWGMFGYWMSSKQ